MECTAAIEATNGLPINKSIVNEVECTAAIEATKDLLINRSMVAEVSIVELITPIKFLDPKISGCELLIEESTDATNGRVTRISIFAEDTYSTEIDTGIGRTIESVFDTVVVVTAEIEAENDLKIPKSMVAEVEYTATIEATKGLLINRSIVTGVV